MSLMGVSITVWSSVLLSLDQLYVHKAVVTNRTHMHLLPRLLLYVQCLFQAKYIKSEKKPTPAGGEVFNQRALYNAYTKRAAKVPYSKEDYEAAKARDPNGFYADANSLEYGKAPQVGNDCVAGQALDLRWVP